jgi:hypothetical protein
MAAGIISKDTRAIVLSPLIRISTLIDGSYLLQVLQGKKSSQRLFSSNDPLELVVYSNFYSRKNKLFDSVVGFAKFSEFSWLPR